MDGRQVKDIPTEVLFHAASAWRKHALTQSGLFGLFGRPNMSAYDRIDELVNEIARLRGLAKGDER